MRISEVRLTKRSGEDSLLAYGSITFSNDFVVSGIKVLRAKDGSLYVGFPSRKDKNGEYKDICYPTTKAFREEIAVEVLSKYEELENES